MSQILYNIPHQENFSREDFITAFKRKIKMKRSLQGDINFRSYYQMGIFIV